MHYITVILLNFVLVKSNNDTESRIVKGNVTEIQLHPYSTFLVIMGEGKGFVCGGSIINQRIILTAAHCFEQVTTSTSIISSVGNINHNLGVKTSVAAIKVHPRYNRRTIINDIALAGLKDPLKLDTRVNRVVLAKKWPNVRTAKLAGWGLLQENPSFVTTSVLHEMTLKVLSQSKCKEILKRLHNGTFCSGQVNTEAYASIGDSGSPVVIRNYIQIGLVSYKNLNISKSVIVYTDIPYFYHWITRNAKLIYCKILKRSKKNILKSGQNLDDCCCGL